MDLQQTKSSIMSQTLYMSLEKTAAVGILRVMANLWDMQHGLGSVLCALRVLSLLILTAQEVGAHDLHFRW